MTIEEARDILQDQIDRYGQEYDAEGIEALEMAIKALEQEPKIGHLLMPDKGYSSKIWRKCSCCGTHIEKYSKYISFDGEAHYIPYRLNYCYVCGAKIVEGSESE